jgi:hypothetical protein
VRSIANSAALRRSALGVSNRAALACAAWIKVLISVDQAIGHFWIGTIGRCHRGDGRWFVSRDGLAELNQRSRRALPSRAPSSWPCRRQAEQAAIWRRLFSASKLAAHRPRRYMVEWRRDLCAGAATTDSQQDACTTSHDPTQHLSTNGIVQHVRLCAVQNIAAYERAQNLLLPLPRFGLMEICQWCSLQ